MDNQNNQTPNGATSAEIPNNAKLVNPTTSANTATANEGFVDIAEELKQGSKFTDNTDFSGNSESSDSADKQQQAAKEASTGAKGSLGEVVSGKFAIDIVDTILPSFIAFASKQLGYDIRKQEFQLTKGEKELLSSPTQSCLNTIPFNIQNPWLALAMTFGAVYGSKFMDKSEEFKKRKKPSSVQSLSVVKEPIEIVNNQKQQEDLKEKELMEEAERKLKEMKQDKPKLSELPEDVAKIEALIKATAKKKNYSRARTIEWLSKNPNNNIPKGYK